ncbi:MAG: helix-hairpin-helix domain-containing protein, partial [Clostridiales bacterium]|nr:helix-hairpin-helix domain-containing protein [Clostridiales bacterium]
MKKIISFILILTVVFSTALIQTNAATAGGNYVAIQAPVTAKVIEVIDADSLLVEISYTGALALVHMVGIDGAGNTAGYEYATAKLVGNLVYIVPDPYIHDPAGRWNYAHVYLGETDLSQDLVANGFAKINTNQSQSSRFGILVAAERAAKDNNIGLWQTGAENYAYSGAIININTASQSELSEYLDLADRFADEIVEYRGKHPFQTIDDIKFVDGMTKELYDEIRNKIGVSTNVLEASAEELTMLISLNENDAENIIDYRDKEDGIKNLSDLYRKGVIRQSQYKQNEPFIARETVNRIDYAKPDKIVDINTATRTQLRAIDLTSAQTDKIMDYREDYSFKTMQDVAQALNLSKTTAAALSDNIDFDATETSYTNLNTASFAQLTSAGFTSAQANQLIAVRPMEDANDIPVNVRSLGVDQKVSLFTNINRASAAELKTLHPQITDTVAESIRTYRQDQPFGSHEEFRAFMEFLGRGYIYAAIEDRSEER